MLVRAVQCLRKNSFYPFITPDGKVQEGVPENIANSFAAVPRTLLLFRFEALQSLSSTALNLHLQAEATFSHP